MLASGNSQRSEEGRRPRGAGKKCMKILLIQVKRNRGKEEIEGNKSEDTETRGL